MHFLSLLLIMATGAAAAPATLQIDIKIQSPATAAGIFQPLGCVAFEGHRCDPSSADYDCCPGFKCLDDGSGHNTKTCHSDCVAPWDIGHTFCGIDKPQRPCCDPDNNVCEDLHFDQNYKFFGCVSKKKEEEKKKSPVVAKYPGCVAFEGHRCSKGDPNFDCCQGFTCKDDGKGQGTTTCQTNTDSDTCVPPWYVGHTFCGINKPQSHCCHSGDVCKDLEFGQDIKFFGCVPKDDKDESVHHFVVELK